MRSDIATVGFLLFFLLIFVFCSNSCSEDTLKDPFEYTKAEFDAEICGTVDGSELSAVIHSHPRTKDAESFIEIKFTYPKTLEGLCAKLYENGGSEVRLGELSAENIDISGLIEPFSAYLSPKEITSAQVGDKGEKILSVCDENCDLKYVFTQNKNYPEKISGNIEGRQICFEAKSFVFLSTGKFSK